MLKLFQTCSSSHKTLLPPKYFYQNSPKIACEPPILPKICPRLSIWLNSVEKCIFTKWSYQKPGYFDVVSAQKAKFWRIFVKFRRFLRFFECFTWNIFMFFTVKHLNLPVFNACMGYFCLIFCPQAYISPQRCKNTVFCG